MSGDPCNTWEGEVQCLGKTGHEGGHDFGYTPLPHLPHEGDVVRVFRSGTWRERPIEQIIEGGRFSVERTTGGRGLLWWFRVAQHGRTWRYAE